MSGLGVTQPTQIQAPLPKSFVGRLIMLFQSVTRFSKNRRLHFSRCCPPNQRGIPRLRTQDRQGLENFKNHSSIDFVFQKEKSTPPIENRLQGRVSREAITDRATLGDPSDLSPHWQSRRRSVMAGFARDRGDRPALAQEIVVPVPFPAGIVFHRTVRAAQLAVDAVADRVGSAWSTLGKRGPYCRCGR